MSHAPQDDSSILLDQHIPIQYKIIDLPITEPLQMNPFRTFQCKIYRKVQFNTGIPGDVSYEWKRKCHGRIKFINYYNKIVVAAFEFGSCHNRLTEQPIQHPLYYNLVASEEFAYNWVYIDQTGISISIALSPTDFMEFNQQWNNAKSVNTSSQEIQWFYDISTDIFT